MAGAALYHWLQAQGRATPWIFPDELRYTEAARAVAETGSPRVRGHLEWDGLLHAYLVAPAWLIDETARAWSTAKGIASVAFSLTAVPTYHLARRVAPPAAALLAAAAAVLLPAAFYASTALQEAFALPIAVTAALLTTRLVERFSVGRALALVAACAAGALVRSQLAVVLVAAAIALLVSWAAASGPRRDRRSLLAAGTILAGSVALALVGRRPAGVGEVTVALFGNPGSTSEVIVRSAGAVAIAVALVPAIAYGVAAARVRARDPAVAALAATLIGFGLAFLTYVGGKAATLDFAPIALVEERNLIYLEPLALVALASLAGRPSWPPLAIGTAVVLALVATFPLTETVTSEILSENPGLSWAGRIAADPRDVDPSLVAMLSAGVLVGAVALAAGRLRLPLLVAVGIAVAWSGALAYRGDHDFSSRQASSTWPVPRLESIDDAAAGRSVVALTDRGQSDLVGLWTAAFWNRSIRGYADFDPFGPRNIGLAGRRTTVTPVGRFALHGGDLVLHPATIAVAGRAVAATLPPAYRLTVPHGAPAEAAVTAALEGRTADGWAGEALRVVRYLEGPPGTLLLDVSAANPFIARPRRVSARIGDATFRFTVTRGSARTLRVPVPAGEWGTEFTFAPAESPGPADPRRLSLQVGRARVPGVPTPLG